VHYGLNNRFVGNITLYTKRDILALEIVYWKSIDIDVTLNFLCKNTIQLNNDLICRRY